MDIGIKKIVMTGLLAVELGFGAAIALTGPSLGGTAYSDITSVATQEIRPASADDPSNTNGYHRPSGGVVAGLKLY